MYQNQYITNSMKMKYDVLYNFISPVTGKVNAPNVAPSDATYILQTPNAFLPNAQALNSLENGILFKEDGGVLITKGKLDRSNLPYLTHNKIWIGDPANIAVEASGINGDTGDTGDTGDIEDTLNNILGFAGVSLLTALGILAAIEIFSNGSTSSSSETTNQMTLNLNMNMAGNRITNLALSPLADFDGVSAKWVWDLLDSKVLINSMGISSLTAANIIPNLDILGSIQEFNYNQNLSTFRLSNNFISTNYISNQTLFEFRNNLLSGFRWIHNTNITDTYGSLTLQSFVNAFNSGTNLVNFTTSGIGTFVPLKFYNSIGTNYVALQAGNVISNVTWTLPITDGSSGQALITNGSGILSWSSTGVGSVTLINTGIGLTGGPITTTGTISLANTTVTPGSYTYSSFTVDAQGRLTVASSGTMPLLPANNLSDLNSASTARTNLGLTNIATQNVTQHYVLVGGASNSITSLGLTNGQLLIGSTNNDPLAAIPTNGTNISWSTGPGSLTANLTGQVALANGGTNANLTASNGGIFYSTASTGAILSGTSTASQILLSGASSAPTWSTTTHPTNTTINQILYSSANNIISGLTTANNGVLITSLGGVPSIGTTLPSAVQGNITSVGTITNGTWNGSTITVPYGGTGIASATAYAVLCSGITSTGAFQSVSGVGTSGQVLTSQGASALPTWASLSTFGVTSITGTANQVLANSTSGSPQIGAVTLTLPQSIATTSNVQFGSIVTTNLTTNGTVAFPNNLWMYGQASTNLRSWYIAGSDMYWELGGNGAFHWRNSSDVDVATLDYLGQAVFKKLGLNGVGTASTLEIVSGNAQIGFVTGTSAPTNGLIVSGNVGIGTITPNSTLNVYNASSQSNGTAMSTTFRAEGPTLLSSIGNESSIASFISRSAVSTSSAVSNSIALGISSYQFTAGSTWTSSCFIVGMDVDNSKRAGSWMAFYQTGIGFNIIDTNVAYRFYVSDSSNIYGMLINGTIAPAGNAVGFTCQNYLSPTVKASVFGLSSQCTYNSPSAGMHGAYGLYINTSITGSGTIDNIFGIYVGDGIVSGPTVTLGYGIFVAPVGYSDTCYGLYVSEVGTVTNKYCAYFGGKVGIKSTPNYTLILGADDAGKTSTAVWFITSDKRIKKNIKSIEKAIPLIKEIRPISFQYTQEYCKDIEADEETINYGFVADEIQNKIPNCVNDSELHCYGMKYNGVDEKGRYKPEPPRLVENLKTFNMHNVIIFTIKAVQELIEQNEFLQARIDILESKLFAGARNV